MSINVDGYPNYRFICVDFDETLCTGGWPDISAGKRIEDTIKFVQMMHARGTKIILFTSRCNYGSGEMFIDDAVNWCKENDVPIDAVNDNPWDDFQKRYPGVRPVKPFADIYIDDRSIHPSELRDRFQGFATIT